MTRASSSVKRKQCEDGTSLEVYRGKRQGERGQAIGCMRKWTQADEFKTRRDWSRASKSGSLVLNILNNIRVLLSSFIPIMFF